MSPPFSAKCRAFLLPLLLAASISARGETDPQDIVSFPNALGFADTAGSLSVWREFGSVDFGEGFSIPLRVQFCSARVRREFFGRPAMASPYLGRGWLCPLLESTILRNDDSPVLNVLLPTGRSVTMLPDEERGKGKTPGFHSADGRWRGELSGTFDLTSPAWSLAPPENKTPRDDTFVMKSEADGWELSFLRGRIQRWKVGGRVLEWIYKDGLVSEIRWQGVDGDAPFSVIPASGGHVGGFVVNGRAHRLRFAPFPLTWTGSYAWDGRNYVNSWAGAWEGPKDERAMFLIACGSEPGLKIVFHDQARTSELVTSQFSDARAAFADDGLRVSLPGREPLELRPDSSQRGAFRSADGKWTATRRGKSVVLSGPEGWQITFTDGRIRQWKNGERVVEWVFKDGAAVQLRIVGVTGKAPLAITLGPHGKPAGFVTDGQPWKLPVPPGHSSELGYDGTSQPTLVEWTTPEDRSENFDFATDHGTPCTLTISEKGKPDVLCAWDPATRWILSADGWRYLVAIAYRDRDLPALITRVDGRGEYEFVAPGEFRRLAPGSESGITFAKTLDAGRTITTRLRRSGMYADEIQRIETLGPDGRYRASYQADFDEAGNFTREYRMDQSGVATLTTYAAGKGIATEKLSGSVSAAREKALLADLKASRTEAEGNRVLEQLGYFYIAEGEFDKALALRQKISDREIYYVLCDEVVQKDKSLGGGLPAMRSLLMGEAPWSPGSKGAAPPGRKGE